MRYLIDSNIWVYAAAGVECVIKLLDIADLSEWAGYSSISRLEVMGYKNFNEGEEAKLNSMLSCFNECEVTKAVIDQAIQLRKATAIKVPDAIVAATALVNHATLVTRNTVDFRNISDLNLLDPFL